MLAHEFEHILEQIEGLDLPTLSRVKGSGVREVEYAVFETERAQAAGEAVAAEVGRYARGRRQRIDNRAIRRAWRRCFRYGFRGSAFLGGDLRTDRAARAADVI